MLSFLFFFFCGFAVEMEVWGALLEVRVCTANYPGFYFCLRLDSFPLSNTSNILGFTTFEAVLFITLMLAVLTLLLTLPHRSIMLAACYDLQLRFKTVQLSGHAHNGNL